MYVCERTAKPSSENGVERGRRRTGRSEDRWETGESGGGGGGGIRNRGARWAWGGGKGAAGSAGRVLYRLRRGRRVYLRTVCAPLRRCVRVVPYSRPGEMRSTGRVRRRRRTSRPKRRPAGLLVVVGKTRNSGFSRRRFFPPANGRRRHFPPRIGLVAGKTWLPGVFSPVARETIISDSTVETSCCVIIRFFFSTIVR